MQIRILPSLLAADFGHLADEARRAESAGADYIGSGTVYPTTTKAEAGPVIGSS